MGFSLLGTGRALPGQVIGNDDLSRVMDTSDEWISSRTGIRRRHIMDGETLTELAAAAAKNALENAGVDAGELDYIICTTIRGDYITPSEACMIQKEIGASCPSFDLNGACSGFIYGLDVAGALFDSGRAKKVLLVSAEAMTKTVNWQDRATCVLFGDGAGAVVLGEGDDLLALRLTAKGDDTALRMPNISGNCPYCKKEPEEPYLHMNGQEVYKFAVSSSCRDIKDLMKQAGITAEEVDHMVFHQANYRIIETAQKKLKIPKEKFALNISENGNVSSASIPILLDEMNRDGRLKKGQKLILSAFGAGFTTGAALLRWSR